MMQCDFCGRFAVDVPCSVDPGVRSGERAVGSLLGSCVPPLPGREGEVPAHVSLRQWPMGRMSPQGEVCGMDCGQRHPAQLTFLPRGEWLTQGHGACAWAVPRARL